MKKMKSLKDGQVFKLSKRKTAAKYKLQRKSKGVGYYTSVSSERTFKSSLDTLVYI